MSDLLVFFAEFVGSLQGSFPILLVRIIMPVMGTRLIPSELLGFATVPLVLVSR